MLSYHDFCASTKGRIIVDLTRHPDSVAEMQRHSRERDPAVAAIDRAIVDEVGRLDDVERQHTGRLVREVLAPLGWHPARRKRLRFGHTFTSGAVYERPAVMHPGVPAARSPNDLPSERMARADEAVAILAKARLGNAGSVDEFIVERRAEARRDEAGW